MYYSCTVTEHTLLSRFVSVSHIGVMYYGCIGTRAHTAVLPPASHLETPGRRPLLLENIEADLTSLIHAKTGEREGAGEGNYVSRSRPWGTKTTAGKVTLYTTAECSHSIFK